MKLLALIFVMISLVQSNFFKNTFKKIIFQLDKFSPKKPSAPTASSIIKKVRKSPTGILQPDKSLIPEKQIKSLEEYAAFVDNKKSKTKSAKTNKWRKDNKDRYNAYKRGYVSKHKDKIKKYSSQWGKDNADKLAANTKRWREKNKDKINQRLRERWREKRTKDKQI